MVRADQNCYDRYASDHGLILQMDFLREPFFDHDDRHRHLAVRILMTTSKWLDNNDYVIM